VGLFDSECAVSGISLTPLDAVACLPLVEQPDGSFAPSGAAVIGRADRSGGLDGETPGAPFALVARPIFDAIVHHAGDVGAWLRQRGRALRPSLASGTQHTDGDVLVKHAAAVRAFADVAWMQPALEECAANAEREAALRLGAEAPPAGWLREAASSWYGVVIGPERRASTSREGVRADIDFLSVFAFDPETLALVEHLGVLVAQRGDVQLIHLGEYLVVENAGQRASLADRARAEEVCAIYGDDDPRIEVDWQRLAERLGGLEPPRARDGSEVLVGSSWGAPPAWAAPGETRYGLTRFAKVVADGWRAPGGPPPPDDTIRDEEIEVELRAGRDAAAALLYRRKNGVGLAEAKAAIEAWRARL
jgi:hypothetical protein